jgi:hypothetical protein
MATVHRLAQEESGHAVTERHGQPRMVTLAEHLAQNGPLSIAESFRIGADLATSLAELHATEGPHLNVSPARVLLIEHGGRVFGAELEAAALERDDIHIIHIAYASPEQLQGRGVDGRSDLFGLGCVLYAMTTGSGPFDGATSEATAFEVCELSPQAVGEVNPRLSAWQAAIIMRLIAKDPDQRFATAREVAELLRMQQSAATLPHRPVPRPRSDPTPRPAETPTALSLDVTAPSPPPPSWSSPLLPQHIAARSIMWHAPAPVSTLPAPRQATPRRIPKIKRRVIAFTVSLLLLVLMGWQMGRELSASLGRLGISNGNKHAYAGSGGENVEYAGIEEVADPWGAAPFPPTVKYPVVSQRFLEDTQCLGVPPRKFTIAPTTKVPRSYVNYGAYLMDKRDGKAKGGSRSMGNPPAGLPLHVLTDPNHVQVSLGGGKPISVNDAIERQWIALEASGGGWVGDTSIVGDFVWGLGADIAFVNLTDKCLDVSIDGPLVVSAERGRTVRNVPLSTLASFVSPVRNEKGHRTNQERIYRDASALLVAADDIVKTPADLGTLAEVIDDFRKRDRTTFVLTKGMEPHELLVIEAGRIKGRLVGEEAKQEFAALEEREPERMAVKEQEPLAMAEGVKPAAPVEQPRTRPNEAMADVPNWEEIMRRPNRPEDANRAEKEAGGKKADKHPPADEQLNKLVTFSYPRITLERAMQRVSAEIGIPITFVTRDLAQAGISKNHSLQLEVFNLTAGECLHHIMALVDRSGRLTFVVRRRADGREEIAVTTHAGVAERNEPRQGEF